MPFTGIVDPEHLAMLATVLEEHCASRGINRASSEGEDAGYVLLSLFGKGARTAEELKAGLDAVVAGENRRLA